MNKQSLIILAVAIAIVALVVVGVVGYSHWYRHTNHATLMSQQELDDYSVTLSNYLRNTGNIARSEYVVVTEIAKELGTNTKVSFQVFNASHQLMANGTLELYEDSLSNILNISIPYDR